MFLQPSQTKSTLYSLQTGPIQVNTWIVPLSEDDVFIVDPAGSTLTGDENTVQQYLTRHNLNPIAVLLTHSHFDHALGLSSIKKSYPNIKIAVYNDETCEKKLCELVDDKQPTSNTIVCKANSHGLSVDSKHNIELNKLTHSFLDSKEFHKRTLEQLGATSILPYLEDIPSPDFFLKDGQTLNCVFNEKKDAESLSQWKVIHTPGHTLDSVCFYNEMLNLLISGDTIFYHSFGRTDLYTGNQSQIIKSISLLKKTISPNTKVFPGHDFSDFLITETI